MMRTIFDTLKLPERNLHVRQMIALDQRMDVGAAIRIVRGNMARNLAEVILRDKTFFWERSVKAANLSTLEYGADCIILTQSEYTELRREAFAQGVEHACDFMPPRFER